MKFKVLVASTLVAGLLAACGSGEPADEQTSGNAEQADVVTTASIVNEADALVKALSEDGNWIVATVSDVTVDEELVVAGEFHDKGDASADIYRKFAPFTQDENHQITESFTITVPKMTVQSENFKIAGGTIKGDIYVEANGFNLAEAATVEGNVYFTNEEVKATAVMDGTVTGATEVAAGEAADVVTTASLVNEPAALVSALSENGTWIVATLSDVTVDEEIVVAGEFYNKNDKAQGIYRKLAPYTQDENHQITESYTITTPKMTVQSENFKIAGGTIAGDVVVEADGFVLDKQATVEGNLTFANEDVKATATIDGKVTGEVK